MKKLKRALLTGLLTCAASSSYAWDLQPSPNLPPVSFHGFLSQGFLATTDYNYLGETKDGSFKFTDIGLSLSFNPFPRTRIAAQGFAYDIGEVGEYDPVLDYAMVEYTFNDFIGVRAGRVRRPQGIYNHVQDLDLARTSVLLPQGLYDARYRDFYVSLDGLSLFGTIPLGKAGSLSYEVYAGFVRPADNGGVSQQLRNVFSENKKLTGVEITLDSIDPISTGGAQLWWNTPVDGLRFGASGAYFKDVQANLEVKIPSVPSFSQDGMQDTAIYQGSAEYVWKSWTFQAEYLTNILYPEGRDASREDDWYVGAAYRFNKWFEAGTYYTEAYKNVDDRDNSLAYQKDVALSLRFDVTDSWIVKVEGHFIHGTGLLYDNASNPVQNDDGWGMIALKTTFSF